MSLPAIEVSGLSKRYVIQHESRHDNLRDTLHHAARKLWRRARWGTGFESEEFWALRDVSFSVQPGEVVGIIGRNGAGKSTLLKILSRITEPTTGSVSLRGRVASLLEVGTGFHPELTGRENVFLNGAILGMSRVEIRKKFDEIVAFAEVERFLDTPVKRYSSGMYVRLAFAVAAHLEPEILIVDEVLAVGDANFQKKCLGKMKSITRQEGRTILFVSHNLDAIRQLCDRIVVLSQGSVDYSGPATEGLARYLDNEALKAEYTRPASAPPTDVSLDAVRLLDPLGRPCARYAHGAEMRIELDVTAHRHVSEPLQIALRVNTSDGTPVFTTTTADRSRVVEPLARGRHRFSVALPQILSPGTFNLTIAICEPRRRVHDAINDEVGFHIDAQGSLGDLLRDDRRGLLEVCLPWTRLDLP